MTESVTPARMRLRYAARSDIGLRREGNEDSGFADSHLLMVADGMGGHAAGELASSMAVATFAEMASEEVPDEEVLEHLADGIDLLSERIGDVILEEPANQGMGTTVTGVAWQGSRAAVVHVGDSRAYLLRDGVLAQITKDHTYVQSLVDSGEITAEEALRHPRRNLLNRAVDGIHAVEADLSMREARHGDRYLLCTDGLSGVVGDERLAEVLRTDSDPTGAVTRLVDMALEGGAPDNVTVVVADVTTAPGASENDPVVVGAAGEPGNRARLPNVPWPIDEQLDPNNPKPRGSRQALPETASPAEPPDVVAEALPPPEAPEESRRAGRWILIAAAIVVSFLAVVGLGLMWWLTGQWYVASDNGRVAIYHGVPGALGPIPLQRLDATTSIPVERLPSYDRTRLELGIITSSEAQAQAVVDELRQHAAECQVNPAEAGCPAAKP